VTVVRVDPKQVNPYYLADYLRVGGGAIQIERLYTGATGLIELQPEEADQILVDLLSDVSEQAKVSKSLRAAENGYRKELEKADVNLSEAREAFAKPAHLPVAKFK